MIPNQSEGTRKKREIWGRAEKRNKEDLTTNIHVTNQACSPRGGAASVTHVVQGRLRDGELDAVLARPDQLDHVVPGRLLHVLAVDHEDLVPGQQLLHAGAALRHEPAGEEEELVLGRTGGRRATEEGGGEGRRGGGSP